MTASDAALRLATWNIRAAIGPGEPFPPAFWRHVDRRRLERIAGIIAGLDADVVALQEVGVMTVDGELLDQPAELARLTGREVRYAATHSTPFVEPADGRVVGATLWGNALLSRLPFADVVGIGLPGGADDELVEPAGSGSPLAGVAFAAAPTGTREPRCVVGARFATAAGEVDVLATHLSYAGAGQRRAQAEALVRMATARGPRLVVAGDLNAPIEAPELAVLAAAFDDAFTATGVGPGDARRASCGPDRIDHILTRGLRAVETRVVAEAGDASDHLPVLSVIVPA